MFEIIIDTREQNPFIFTSSKIKDIHHEKLDSGDYTIKGFEDKLFIERKQSVAEFYNNVNEKRFWDEIERSQTYKYRYIIFEFSASDVEMFPYGSGLPKNVISKLKISSAYLMKCIAKIQVKFDIHVIFGGNRDNSIYLITNIMKEISQLES